LAAVEHGEVGLIASDVTDYLGPAVLNLMAEDQDE
jgi:hypothetical protein